MKYNTKSTYKIFWDHARQYKWSGLILVISVIIASVLSLVPPLLYKNFFDVLSTSDTGNAAADKLLSIIYQVLAVYIVMWIFWRIAEFVNSFFQTQVMRALSQTCFSYLHKHSFSFFQNNFGGALVKKVNRFSRSFESLADTIVWEILQLFVYVVLITAILFWKNWIFGISIIVWVILLVAVNYLFSIYKLKYDIQRSEQDSAVTGILSDTITNNSNIKLFTGYEREQKLFADANDKLQALRYFTWNLGSVFNAIQTLFMIVLEAAILYFAVKLWARGFVTIGDFVLIQAYILNIFHRFWNFGKIIRAFYENLADAEEMTEILNTPHEIKDKRNAKKINVTSGKIDFTDISFNYNQTRSILEEFTLSIKGQEKVALIGPSGAGKSTVIKLLLRMHDATAGKIKIDNQKISDVTQDSLWANISYVPQEPILFHRSLMENIRYGKPDATDEEVFEAARLAHCHEFIKELSEGYDTFVGERGIKLSGGERQRVAIARAILRNAPILILDEATSSLDSESEKLIQEALDELMRNKTVIVIAHRLSTIMRMDRIIVIADGQVKEDGTHGKLLENEGGLYRKLWEVQVSGFIE